MTFRGAVVGWTPIEAGASGRARCRNDFVSTTMMGSCFVSGGRDLSRAQDF